MPSYLGIVWRKLSPSCLSIFFIHVRSRAHYLFTHMLPKRQGPSNRLLGANTHHQPQMYYSRSLLLGLTQISPFHFLNLLVYLREQLSHMYYSIKFLSYNPSRNFISKTALANSSHLLVLWLVRNRHWINFENWWMCSFRLNKEGYFCLLGGQQCSFFPFALDWQTITLLSLVLRNHVIPS